ncbi:MAG: CRISPR-associated protein Csm7 [Magnetococcales bacterium]|nr:CRISPR-associated protein Csm7 [Magnetococcales bacterium]
MQTLLVTLQPQTALATLPYGDTLLGQLCWALRNRHGDDWLRQRLEGYTSDRPFLVVSDLLPAGYWPRPHLPANMLAGDSRSQDRKADKKKIWLPRDGWQQPLQQWLQACKTEKEVWPEFEQNGKRVRHGRITESQPHNAINRITGTTGEEGFAPYAVEQIWFPPGAQLELWLLHDPQRLPQPLLEQALEDIGSVGFGKDASIGLGKFGLIKVDSQQRLPMQPNSNSWLTLGPCAPQGGGFNPQRSYYQLFTRFGRHGDVAALTGQPFKSPVLLVQAGAVLTPQQQPLWSGQNWVGQGLGGDGSISRGKPETVQQGYCPVVGIDIGGELSND